MKPSSRTCQINIDIFSACTLLLTTLACSLTSPPLPAFGQPSPPASYDVQVGTFASEGKARASIRKLKQTGAPVYTVPDTGGWKLIVDTNASHQNAADFIAKHLPETKAVPVESTLDVAPNAAVVKTGIYPANQLYTYRPKRDASADSNKQEATQGEATKRITVRELASMPADPEKLSASELAALPPKPPKLSARELARLAGENIPLEQNTAEADVPKDTAADTDIGHGSADRTEFIEVISDYICREYQAGAFASGQPELTRKMATYYAAWIYDAARLYRLDPFLMVAIPNHETYFMNVNGDMDHYTDGVLDNSEGIFQMLKTTQVAVYNHMRDHGLHHLLAWRPGQDLKKFPRDQAYMAAHFLRFFCDAHPKNYRNALTTYNGSSAYPNKVLQKLKQVTNFYVQATS